ncbi:MAG: mandelate racemase/muconate lactonizing enzyme family protein, partial [Pirellulaceae bacterium]|nr:mandelate racemase/muconate lactonizing enzyme family protein [Pirellulaceae bacterium]
MDSPANVSEGEKGCHTIRDIKVMMLQGPSRSYTLVKIVADNGIYGIGEAYGSPGVGVKEQIEDIKPALIGKDPLEIDVLYTLMGRNPNPGTGWAGQTRTDGSAHALMRAASGIEMALWDLAGKILGVPSTVLLGGKFREKVRVYNHARPRDILDRASCEEWAQQVKEAPAGFTCHKFGFPHTTPDTDKGRDFANRVLTVRELRQIEEGFANCREALGWDHDIMVHCHWEYGVRTAIQIAEAVAPIKPFWLEDAMIVNYTDSWKRLTASSPVPICTGENLWRRQEFADFMVNQGCDIFHPDLRNSGGFLENKRIADMAEVWGMPMATHNT